MSKIPLQARIERLEKQITTFQILCAVQVIALCLATYILAPSRVQASQSSQVLRAKGLIIEDAQGRARVLLGAPFPDVKDRIRQDALTQSMIFLDKDGHDRLTVGEEPSAQTNSKVDPNWRRIAPGFGVLIHDDQGNERGGFGWLGNGRAAFVLDRPGLDAVGTYVDDMSGFAGTVVEYPPNTANDVNGIEFGTQGDKSFLRFKDTQGKTRATFELSGGKFQSEQFK